MTPEGEFSLPYESATLLDNATVLRLMIDNQNPSVLYPKRSGNIAKDLSKGWEKGTGYFSSSLHLLFLPSSSEMAFLTSSAASL